MTNAYFSEQVRVDVPILIAAGEDFYKVGQYADALAKFLEAFNKTAEKSIDRLVCLGYVSRANYSNGEKELAVTQAKQALEELKKQTGDESQLKSIRLFLLSQLGRACFGVGKFAQGAKAHGEILDSINANDDLYEITLSNKAIALRYAGGFEEAVALLKEAIQLAEADKNVLIATKYKSNLGRVCYALGDLAQARSLQQAALDFYQAHESEHHLRRAIAYAHIARVDYSEGDMDKALLNAKTAMKIFSDKYSKMHPETIETHLLLAEIHFAMGNSAEAVEELSLCSQLCKKGYGENLQSACKYFVSPNVTKPALNIPEAADNNQLTRFVDQMKELFGEEHPLCEFYEKSIPSSVKISSIR